MIISVDKKKSRELPSELEIRAVVGESTFLRWMKQANRDMNFSPYWYRESAARQAYRYSELLRRYRLHQKYS